LFYRCASFGVMSASGSKRAAAGQVLLNCLQLKVYQMRRVLFTKSVNPLLLHSKTRENCAETPEISLRQLAIPFSPPLTV